MTRTPEEILNEHAKKFAKMLSENFGDEEVIDFSPEAETQDALSHAVTQIDVTPMGNMQVVTPRDDIEDSQEAEEYSQPELPLAPREPKVIDRPQEQWSYQHDVAPQAEPSPQFIKPEQPKSQTNWQKAPSQPAKAEPKSNLKEAGRKATADLKKTWQSSAEFLHQRYGVHTSRIDVGEFVHNGPSSSAKQPLKSNTAGRPQPPPAGGNPSHPPFPLLGFAPKLPEPEDIDAPVDPSLGQFPQEGKRRQSTANTDNLAESLDMAAEQLLSIVDRMAYKLQSVSQRLVVLESLVDRTY